MFAIWIKMTLTDSWQLPWSIVVIIWRKPLHYCHHHRNGPYWLIFFINCLHSTQRTTHNRFCGEYVRLNCCRFGCLLVGGSVGERRTVTGHTAIQMSSLCKLDVLDCAQQTTQWAGGEIPSHEAGIRPEDQDFESESCPFTTHVGVSSTHVTSPQPLLATSPHM